MERAVERVRRTLVEACSRSGRDPSEVRLVAITKGVPVDVIRMGLEAGLTDFGENYAKDLAAKAPAVPARWHFVGKLQGSNAAKIADVAAVIHSAEPGQGLERVARRASRESRPIDALVQVDFTGRRQGVAPDGIEPFLRETSALPALRFVGLMTVPPAGPGGQADPELPRPYFARLRQLRDGLGERWPELRELSMGMSADYPVAVEEGATMVRVGTALFGERPTKPPG